MKKLFFALAAMAIVAVSCQKEFTESASDVTPRTEVESAYAISEEKAIERLNEFMQSFDGCETRAVQRVVKSIDAVEYSDIVKTTRGSEDIDIDNLLYIVEFEDGMGSAIIGADRRVEPVYAILDESVLTTEDFENAANGVELDEISTYTAGLIAQNAINRASTYNLLPNVDLTYDEYYYVPSTSIVTYIQPMLNTKWHQGSPYNDNYPTFTRPSGGQVNAPAGCGTIAVGQLLTYLKPTTTVTLNGHTHSYANMAQFTFDRVITDPILKQKMAQFMYDLAEEMNSEYAYNETGSSLSDNADLIDRKGLSNVRCMDFDRDIIRTMLSDAKPIIVRGSAYNVEGKIGHHAWIIDGRKHTQTSVAKVTIRDGVVISSEYQYSYTTDYIHCNFGWDGECDGYYGYDIFDTTIPRPNEPDFGDVIDPYIYIYDTYLKMIKYNL